MMKLGDRAYVLLKLYGWCCILEDSAESSILKLRSIVVEMSSPQLACPHNI